MSSFTFLAIILGIAVGVGGSYWYVRRKSKSLIKKGIEFVEKNADKFAGAINTLKSEVGEVHQNPIKKEGETCKEVSTKIPAPSSVQEVKKKVVKDDNK